MNNSKLYTHVSVWLSCADARTYSFFAKEFGQMEGTVSWTFYTLISKLFM